MSPTFGQELLRRRAERGLSLAQLARLVPCHRGYIAQLEHGDRHPSPEFAKKLDEVFDAGGTLTALAMAQPVAAETATDVDDDEFEAFELGRRVAASDIGTSTLTALDLQQACR